jgi:2Fe-2S ferredoxin
MPKVRFEPDGVEIAVPLGTTILDAAEQSGARLGSACGGVCACSTCHVYVKDGLEALSEMEEGEEDILDKAFDVRRTSRLACQAKLQEERCYIVEITSGSRQTYIDEHPELRRG